MVWIHPEFICIFRCPNIGEVLVKSFRPLDLSSASLQLFIVQTCFPDPWGNILHKFHRNLKRHKNCTLISNLTIDKISDFF